MASKTIDFIFINVNFNTSLKIKHSVCVLFGKFRFLALNIFV